MGNLVELEFRGTDRFEITRRIGEGGMGIVYEARDKENNARCALKTLRRMEPQSLYRLKREFRGLADLVHPNLISLGELVEAEGEWFFTMELVEGLDFRSYVRGGDGCEAPESSATASVDTAAPRRRESGAPGVDEDRLRDVLRQLAIGLAALHDAGKVHRDIKPSNVLVTAEGRVVILDFGLVAETGTSQQSTDADVVGTAAYMAPEQAITGSVGPAADWYSVGVMLYEALTGQLPFTGPPLAVLLDKQEKAPPPPRALRADTPEDLDALCQVLLHPDPAQRPRVHTILSSLGGDRRQRTERVTTQRSQAGLFVGRRRELAILWRAFEDSRALRTVTVHVHGESGVGKTALIHRFLEETSARSDAVVLSGRCYERESVPYKALDGVIDALSRYLRRLPRAEAAALLPRNVALLPRVFPVLGRVDLIADAQRPRFEETDPHEIRREVFTTLRELLCRVTDVRALIIFIDDLQWADHDSFVLLDELLRPPEPPPVLLVCASREALGRQAEQERGQGSRWTIPGDVRTVSVSALEQDDARELAHELLSRAQLETAVESASVAAEAGGHPLYISELIRHAGVSDSRGQRRLQLDEAIWARVCLLPEDAKRLLATVCVASAPLPQYAIRIANGMEAAAFAKRVGLLRAANLARSQGGRARDLLEPFHDRVREAVREHLEQSMRRRVHSRLATALRASGLADTRPELIVPHLEAIGEIQDAADYARNAAEIAEETLAFDRAVRLYQRAIGLQTQRGQAPLPLRKALARSLFRAGRLPQAALEYLAAAELAEPDEALECQRLAAESYLCSGHLDEGISILREALGTVGLSYPKTTRRAVASLLLLRVLLRFRGYGFRETERSSVSRDDLRRLEITWTAWTGLGLTDPARAFSFNARHLLHALRVGEPGLVVRAFMGEIGFLALGGLRTRRRVLRIQEVARPLVGDDPYLRGWQLAGGALADFQVGEFAEASRKADEADQLIAGLAGSEWERHSLRTWGLWSLFYLGRVKLMAERALGWFRLAEERGNLFAATNYCTSLPNTAWLVGDAPDIAEREAWLHIEKWPRDIYRFQHYWYFLARMHCHLYSERGADALRVAEEEWLPLKRSYCLRAPIVAIETMHLQGRAALAAACDNGDPGECARKAERVGRRLLHNRLAFSRALARLLLAGAANVRADKGRARALLEEAVERCEETDMALYSAAARSRLGQLIGGDEGAALVEEAECWMREQGIARPDRWTAMLAPGFV